MLRQFESFQRKILCEIFPAYSFDSIANLIGVYSDMTFACKVHHIMIIKCSCVCYVLCHMQKHFLLHLEIRNSNIGWNYTWNFRNEKFNVTLKEHQLSDISTELNCTDIIGLYWYGHICTEAATTVLGEAVSDGSDSTKCESFFKFSHHFSQFCPD